MKRIAIVIAASLALAGNAFGAPACSWTTAPANINFGNYTVFGGSLTATSGYAINCVPPASGTVKLSTGGAGVFSRFASKTTAPTGTLGYNLFVDASGSTASIWGDGTSGTQFQSYTGTAGNKDFTGTIYGIVPAGLDGPPGTYTDTIQATLSGTWGTDSRFITVTITILAECNVSTTPLNFGNYDPVVANATAANPLDNTTVVNVFCTAQTPVTVALDNGVNASGSTRRLKSGVNLLNYEMYLNSGRSTIWNATNLNSGTSTSKNIAIANGFTVYGRIAGGQDVPAGAYGDTVTVTVNY